MSHPEVTFLYDFNLSYLMRFLLFLSHRSFPHGPLMFTLLRP